MLSCFVSWLIRRIRQVSLCAFLMHAWILSTYSPHRQRFSWCIWRRVLWDLTRSPYTAKFFTCILHILHSGHLLICQTYLPPFPIYVKIHFANMKTNFVKRWKILLFNFPRNIWVHKRKNLFGFDFEFAENRCCISLMQGFDDSPDHQ